MRKEKQARRSGVLFALMLLVMVFAIGTTSVEAATVKLNKTSATIYVGKTTTLKVSGTSKTVTWSSSNKKVATVSSKGKVTAVKAGTATIKAKVGGKTYSCKVTVKSPYLSKTSTTLVKGATSTLTLTGATVKSVSSSKTSVATVSKTSSGVKITAKKSGTATVTVKDTNGKKYTCKVTVRVGVLSTTSTTMIKGATKTLSLSYVDIKSVSSSKTSVATVSKTASRKLTITAKKTGTTTITVKDKYGNPYKCTVTVRLGLLGSSSVTVKVGNTKTLNMNYVDIQSVSSSKTSVATVSKTSSRKVTITAKKAGTTTVTVKDIYGNSYKCTVTVKNVLVTGVTLNKSALTLDIGKTASLTATVAPSNATNQNVTWISSNKSVATVSSSGVVTAVKAGTATITALAADGSGYNATCEVTVNPQLVTGITLSASALTLEIGETSTLTATITPGTATNKNLTWGTSNTSVVTVSASGKITATGAGTATITATARDGSGIQAACEVTVNPADTSGEDTENSSEDTEDSSDNTEDSEDSSEGSSEDSSGGSSADTTGGTLTLGVEKAFSLDGTDADYSYDYVEYTYTPEITGTIQLSMFLSNRTTLDGGISLYQGDTYLTYGKWYYLYENETGERSLKIYLIYSLTAGVEYTFRVYSSEAVSGTVLLQNYSFALSGVTGDVTVYDVNYYKNYASIYLCGKTADVPDFAVVLENALDITVEESGSYEYGDVVEWIYLTDSEGNTYTYKIYYNIDPSVFEVQGVSGDGAMVVTSVTYDNDTAYMKIAGTEETLTDAFTLHFREGVFCDIVKLEDDYATVKLTYEEVAVYYIYIDYICDTKVPFAISDVTGTDITSYNTLQYDNYGYLNIFGTTTSMPDFTLAINDGISYTVSTKNENYSAVITMTSGDSTYTYYVKYYYDTTTFEILSVTGDITRASWHTDNNTDGQLYLYGLTSTMPEFEIETKEGVTYTITTEDSGTSLVMTDSSGRIYTYQVYYSFDSNLFKISSVSGIGIYNYSSTRTADGGKLIIYGTEEELSDYTVTLASTSLTITSQDSSSLVLRYGDYTYTYTIVYYYTSLSAIALDEEVSITLTSDTSGTGFTFTPETSGTYTFYSYSSTGDPYCALYQGETLVTSDDDSGDGLNFSLTVELEAGVEYTFIVEEIREKGSCTVKLVAE